MKPRARSVYFSIFIVFFPQPAAPPLKARIQHLHWVSADRIDIRQPAPRGRAADVWAGEVDVGSPSRENHLAPGGFCVASRGALGCGVGLPLGLTDEARRPGTKWGMALGEPTMPSIGSAIASDGMLSDTDRWRWAPRLPSPTSLKTRRKEVVTVTSTWCVQRCVL